MRSSTPSILGFNGIWVCLDDRFSDTRRGILGTSPVERKQGEIIWNSRGAVINGNEVFNGLDRDIVVTSREVQRKTSFAIFHFGTFKVVAVEDDFDDFLACVFSAGDVDGEIASVILGAGTLWMYSEELANNFCRWFTFANLVELHCVNMSE